MRKSYYALTFIAILFFSSNLLSQKTWQLDECINYADENNLQVQQIQYANKINKAYLKQAKAQRLPSLSASLGTGYARGQTFDQIGRIKNTYDLQGGENIVSIKNLQPGLYYLKFSEGTILKLIVN